MDQRFTLALCRSCDFAYLRAWPGDCLDVQAEVAMRVLLIAALVFAGCAESWEVEPEPIVELDPEIEPGPITSVRLWRIGEASPGCPAGVKWWIEPESEGLTPPSCARSAGGAELYWLCDGHHSWPGSTMTVIGDYSEAVLTMFDPDGEEFCSGLYEVRASTTDAVAPGIVSWDGVFGP